MCVRPPHFLLYSDAGPCVDRGSRPAQRWRFLLTAVDGTETVEAAEDDNLAGGERLELLALVRGLEALNQPSRVTLITSSRYVSHGLRYGLHQWQLNGWRWECFGEHVPVKDQDLWQRVDRALEYHELECRTFRCDTAHSSRPEPSHTHDAEHAVAVGAER